MSACRGRGGRCSAGGVMPKALGGGELAPPGDWGVRDEHNGRLGGRDLGQVLSGSRALVWKTRPNSVK